MAKKKNQSKKHKFKYASPATGDVALSSDQIASSAEAGSGKPVARSKEVRSRQVAQATVVIGARDFSYVGADLRRIALLAVFLVALEVVLWLILGHTGVGNSIYQLVQV
jgi:hypothetical protein